MSGLFTAPLALAIVAGLLSPALAASLQVSPVSVEIPAPGAASIVTLRNLGNGPINVQVRVFRWTQEHGEDVLSPAVGVAASPPAVKLNPQHDYAVRVVRTAKTPVEGEEAYRLLVDELPKPTTNPGANVKFVVRYSIPVFFTDDEVVSKVTWAAELRGGRLTLIATNDGDSRLRISAMKVEGKSGGKVSFGDGLVGYVLGHSTAKWTARAKPKGIGSGSSITITAQGNNGPITATATVRPAN